MGLLIATLATSTLMPQAFASELGSALQKTFEANRFYYTTTADVSFEKNLEADMPFNLSMKVKEEGGKIADNYAEKGTFSMKVSDIADLPQELNDLSYIDFSTSYRADYEDATQTAYLLLDTLKVNTDGKEAKVVTDMMNEIAKMYTGKAFKLSSKELAEVLSSHMSGMINAEELLTLNALSENSVQSMTKAFGMMLDGLVESGVLMDSVTNDSSRRLRGTTGGQVHTLTLADSITSAQAEMLKETLATFIESLLPSLASDLNAELQYLPSEEMAAQVNEALAAFQGAGFMVEVVVDSGLMQSMDVMADLTSLEVPLTMNMKMDLDYSRGYEMVVPRNPENVININTIVEGFVQLFGIGTSSYMTPSYDETWSEYDTNYYLVLDTVDVIADHIWSVCGEDQMCRRNKINELKRELRRLKNDGYIYPQEYQWKLIELNSLR